MGLKETLIEQLNVTEKQAEFLLPIARFGVATSQILQIVDITNGAKSFQNTYKKIEQLKNKKLIKTKLTQLAGTKYLILPTNKLIQAAKTGGHNIPRLPTSSVQLRHNMIAIAITLMINNLKNFDGYLTTNQINMLKKKNIWKSKKTPDAVLIDKSKQIGHLIEVELNIKKLKDYENAFMFFHKEKLPAIKNGFGSMLYFVDSQKKRKKLQKFFNALIDGKDENVALVAQKCKVYLLNTILKSFNDHHSTNLKIEYFNEYL